jgi:uncharacterized membrane protein YagU involved in acid resistance
MQIRFLTAPSQGNSLWHKVLAFIFTTMLVLLALTFSAVLLFVALVFGALAWAFLWWKLRALRKQIRDSAPRAERTRTYDATQSEAQGVVIEGEVTRVDVS